MNLFLSRMTLLTGVAILLTALTLAPANGAEFKITGCERLPAGNQLRLRFQDGVAGRNYRLESSAVLGVSANWQVVPAATIAPLAGGNFEVLTAFPTNHLLYYRVALAGSPNDLDGDGLLNLIETEGWTVVTLDAMGIATQKTVTSEPGIPDTDSDGLSDKEERDRGLDPRRLDTDGDGLTDYEETRDYFTNPAAVDSDGDAKGDSRFLDGPEVRDRGTSPNLPDTDGDKRPDPDEILGNGNALISDLPRPAVEILENTVELILNVTYSTGITGTTNYKQTLGQSQTTALRRSDATSTQTSLEASASITAGVEATAGLPPGVTVSASATVGFSAGYMEQNTVTVDSEKSQQSQEQFETYQEDSVSSTESAASGEIAVNVLVTNRGTVAFTLKNLSINALRRNPTAPASPIPVATLQVDVVQDGVTLGQGQGAVLTARNNNVNAAQIKELLRDPTQLSFTIANFDLLDAEQRNYAFFQETNAKLTAGLTIDFGNGPVNNQLGRVERYRVATNVRIDTNTFPKGVTIKDVFEKYLRSVSQPNGIPYTVATNSVTGRRVLEGIRGVKTDVGVRHFWVVAANDRFIQANQGDFDASVLMPGDQVSIFYVTDEDDDQLIDREEFIYGTSDTSVDTDGDGLGDFEEVRTGWNVGVTNRPVRRVFPNPVLVDTDGDGRTDLQERNAGTDPRLKDTDLDGFPDNSDPNPLLYTLVTPTIVLQTPTVDGVRVVVKGTATGKPALVNVRVNWADGSPATVTNAPPGTETFNFTVEHVYASGATFNIQATVRDVNGQTNTATAQAQTVAFPRQGLLGEYLFDGNLNDTSGLSKHGTANNGAPFMVPSRDRFDRANRAYFFDPDANFSSDGYGSVLVGNGTVGSGWAYSGSYTISAWIQRDDHSGGDRIIVSQDGSPAFFLRDGVKLAFGLPNQNPAVAAPTNTPVGIWKHVAVVVNSTNSTFTLYVDGRTNAQSVVTNPGYTYSNTARGRIGISGFGSGNPDRGSNFRGDLDAVRIYGRALRADEVKALSEEGP